jgi:hypothetical protein
MRIGSHETSLNAALIVGDRRDNFRAYGSHEPESRASLGHWTDESRYTPALRVGSALIGTLALFATRDYRSGSHSLPIRVPHEVLG